MKAVCITLERNYIQINTESLILRKKKQEWVIWVYHQVMINTTKKWIIKRWSSIPRMPVVQSPLTSPKHHLFSTLIEVTKNNQRKSWDHRIDINVRTLFSLSTFLAVGVLFSLRSSSMTTFSTLSMLFSSFLCGVKHAVSSALCLVISSNIFGTFPIVGGQCLIPIVGCGDVIEMSCSSWAPDVDTEGTRTVWSWSIGLSVNRPSLSPRRDLLLSIA